MEDQVENSVKQHRAEIMIDECEKIREDFLKNQIGKTLEIIPEENHNGQIQGYTANYIPVKANGTAEYGKIIKIKITHTEGDFCVGEIV